MILSQETVSPPINSIDDPIEKTNDNTSGSRSSHASIGTVSIDYLFVSLSSVFIDFSLRGGGKVIKIDLKIENQINNPL